MPESDENLHAQADEMSASMLGFAETASSTLAPLGTMALVPATMSLAKAAEKFETAFRDHCRSLGGRDYGPGVDCSGIVLEYPGMSEMLQAWVKLQAMLAMHITLSMKIATRI